MSCSIILDELDKLLLYSQSDLKRRDSAKVNCCEEKFDWSSWYFWHFRVENRYTDSDRLSVRYDWAVTHRGGPVILVAAACVMSNVYCSNKVYCTSMSTFSQNVVSRWVVELCLHWSTEPGTYLLTLGPTFVGVVSSDVAQLLLRMPLPTSWCYRCIASWSASSSFPRHHSENACLNNITHTRQVTGATQPIQN